MSYRSQLTHTRFIFELYRLSKDNKDAYAQYVSLVNTEGVGLIKTINWKSVKCVLPSIRGPGWRASYQQTENKNYDYSHRASW